MDRERKLIWDLMLEYGKACRDLGILEEGLEATAKDYEHEAKQCSKLWFEIDNLIRQRECWLMAFDQRCNNTSLTPKTPRPIPSVGSGAKVDKKGLIARSAGL